MGGRIRYATFRVIEYYMCLYCIVLCCACVSLYCDAFNIYCDVCVRRQAARAAACGLTPSVALNEAGHSTNAHVYMGCKYLTSSQVRPPPTCTYAAHVGVCNVIPTALRPGAEGSIYTAASLCTAAYPHSPQTKVS